MKSKKIFLFCGLLSMNLSVLPSIGIAMSNQSFTSNLLILPDIQLKKCPSKEGKCSCGEPYLCVCNGQYMCYCDEKYGKLDTTTYSLDYNQGLMGHRFKFTIKSITPYLSTPFAWLKSGFYTREQIERGEVPSKDEYSVLHCNTSCISSSTLPPYVLTKEIARLAGADQGDEKISDSDLIREGWQYEFDAKMSYTKATKANYFESYKLSEKSVEKLPYDTSYSVSVGLYGPYSYITGIYTEYTKWWWGEYVTSGTKENTAFSLVFSNEQYMTLSYIYKHVTSNKQVFYSMSVDDLL